MTEFQDATLNQQLASAERKAETAEKQVAEWRDRYTRSVTAYSNLRQEVRSYLAELVDEGTLDRRDVNDWLKDHDIEPLEMEYEVTVKVSLEFTVTTGLDEDDLVSVIENGLSVSPDLYDSDVEISSSADNIESVEVTEV